MDQTNLAGNFILNALQRSGVSPGDYGLSVQGNSRERITAWCLVVLTERHMVQHDIEFPCLPLLRVRPWLLVRVARHVPLTSSMIFAFMCLLRATIRDLPTERQTRAALSALSCLLHRIPSLAHCFGYVRNPRHRWSPAVWRCLDE
ncbi:nonstructural protein 7b [Pteropus rufus nobecovirus]|nr:nonstructural protein 7b [Pteropus rufus nobecovirus]